MSLLLSKSLCLAAAWGINSLPCVQFQLWHILSLTALALVGVFSPEISTLAAQGKLTFPFNV